MFHSLTYEGPFLSVPCYMQCVLTLPTGFKKGQEGAVPCIWW